MQSFESGYRTSLTRLLEPGDTSMFVETPPTVTTGRLYLRNGSQQEWIKFDGVSGDELLNLTRELSQTAIPVVSEGTGGNRIAGTRIELVYMHDQIPDKNEAEQFRIEALTFADETARDAELGGNGVATQNWTNVFVQSTGAFYRYNTTTNQWETTGTSTPPANANDTTTGIVRVATQAQVDAGTDTEAGSSLSVLPSQVQSTVQSGKSTFATTGGTILGTDTTNAYTLALTPAITALTEGMKIRIKIHDTNTTKATLDVNGTGVKAILAKGGAELVAGQLALGDIVELLYDGTQFIYTIVPEIAETTNITNNDANSQNKIVTMGDLVTLFGPRPVAGDAITLAEDLVLDSVGGNAYVLIKDFRVDQAGGYTIEWEQAAFLTYSTTGSDSVQVRIYVNGSAVSPVFTSSSSNGEGAYTANTYDLSGLLANDEVQIYGLAGFGGTFNNLARETRIRNARLKCGAESRLDEWAGNIFTGSVI